MVRSARAYAGLAARLAAVGLGSKRPFKVTLSLTDRCDCRCEGCFIWRKAEKANEPGPGDVGRLLADMPSLRWLNLTGGEIFLRDDIPAIVEAALAAQPRLAVLDFPTTGQRTEQILADVARIARLGVPRFYVTVSLEGPPAVHDRLRGRPGAFDRMVRTLAGLRQLDGVQTFLGMTLSDANAHLVEEALAAVQAHLPDGAAPIGWRDLHLNVFTTSGHYYDNRESGLGPPASLERTLRKALRVRERSPGPADRIEATYLRLLPSYLRTGRSPLPCRSLRAGVFVGTNGDVYPCTVWSRKLGNAYRDGLSRVLATPGAEEARAVIARDACPGCWSPCEAHPTIVATAPGSLFTRRR